MSWATLIKEDRESSFNTPFKEYLSPNLDGNMVPALIDSDESLGADFVNVLKRSWVYSRNAAFRQSTFSSDRHSTTWSCLSDLTVSEVSNISVFGLVITVEEVNNPHRLSQTWSNDPELPMWPLVPSTPASKSTAVPKQLLLGKSLPALPQSNDEPLSVETVKEPVEGTSMNLANGISSTSSTSSGSTNSDLPTTPISNHDAGSVDEHEYPCKGCGEVSHPTHFV